MNGQPTRVFLNVKANGYVVVDIATDIETYKSAYKRNYMCVNRVKFVEYMKLYNKVKEWTCDECGKTIKQRSKYSHIKTHQ